MISVLLLASSIFLLVRSTEFPNLTADEGCRIFKTANDCLGVNQYFDCGWCADLEDPNAGVCLHGNSIAPAADEVDVPAHCKAYKTIVKGVEKDVTSPMWEFHDLIFSGTVACTTLTPPINANDEEIKAAESKCISGENQSTCSWCPSSIDMFSSIEGKARPRCMFRYNNEEAVSAACNYVPDIFVECSTFKTCSLCAEKGKGMCNWCPGERSCIQSVENSEYEDFYDNDKMLEVCPAQDSSNKPGFDSSCCDEYGIEDKCNGCAGHWGSINLRQCMWSNVNQNCVKAPEERTFEKIEEVCPGCNYFGKEYCNDECYKKSKDCKTCVADNDCVWISEATYHTTDSTKYTLEQPNFCFKGSMSGPKTNSITIYPQFTFTMKTFYYLTCSMPAKTLMNLIIGLSVAVVALAIIIFIVAKAVKRAKYAKLIKKAQNTYGIGQEIDNGNEEEDNYVLALQTVPWEDEIDEVKCESDSETEEPTESEVFVGKNKNRN